MTRLMMLVVVLSMVSFGAWSYAKPVEVEVGSVAWGRDLDAAYARSAETGKPVLVLFQEVPGCQGCQDFGKTVLTQPLLVEAIEDSFVPVLVYNNRGGEDRKLLKAFNEPAWNFQVIRYLDAKGKDIIPRKDVVWTLDGNAKRMVDALKAAKRPVPAYLESLAYTGAGKDLAVAAVAQYCFWTGEVAIGKLDGVVSTEAGFYDGHEVTKVIYDPQRIDLAGVVRGAAAGQKVDAVYVPQGSPTAGVSGVKPFGAGYRVAPASDQMRQMNGYGALLALPGLTEMQETKLNALIRTDRDQALAWLSPRQQAALLSGASVK